ncbi:espin-like protein isoform X2 [Paramisgurnus dabryanus]|uniref:espin-like protein isoform X2 n=1 Tax=Paramisgurnus dabryanus TaxID=90735 RepID=UPI003CCEFF78
MRLTVTSNQVPHACTPVTRFSRSSEASSLITGVYEAQARATFCSLVRERKGYGWAMMSTGALCRLSLPLQLTGQDLLLSSANSTPPTGRQLGVNFPCMCVCACMYTAGGRLKYLLFQSVGSSQRQQVQRGTVDMVLQKAITAAREGDLQCLRELSETGRISIAIADAQGAGLLHHAARCGQLECLCFLVTKAGLPANTRALNGATPVHDAAATGHTRELQWLVQVARCNVKDQDSGGATPLHLAARFGRVEAVHWLLAHGDTSQVETKCGALPAHYAALKGDLTCLKLLIGQAPGCVNRQTNMGATPLYLACQEGNLHVVEYLIKDCGADVHLRAQDGMTSLHAAAHMGHHALVVWLAKFTDICLSNQDNEGATALHFAASGGYHQILDCLLQMGSKVKKDYWGGTPLHDAAENGAIELSTTAQPLEENCTIEEELREKPAVSRQLSSDYYRQITNINNNMDSLKHPEIEDSPQAHYPSPNPPPSTTNPPVTSPPSSASHGNTFQHVHMATTVVKNLNSSTPASKILPEKGRLLMGDMKLGDVKSIASLKKSVLTADLTISNKMVVLPTEEANLSDIDYLVPNHDGQGRPIAEWKRQVMVRQLQTRLFEQETQRLKENGSRFAKVDSWRYSHAHNAILGPFGELLTEDDLIYLEKQIESVSMQKHCEGYEIELARLAEELRNILPAPIVNITVNTQYRNPSTQTPLPVWCNRISGIVKSMSLLMTNLTDQPYCKMPDTELVNVFSQASERQAPNRGRREKIESEIHQFGVSVRNLKSNFEDQNASSLEDLDKTESLCRPDQEPVVNTLGEVLNNQVERPEANQSNVSGTVYGDISNVMESTSLRKERIVVLFLGHWKKSAYTVTVKNAQRKKSVDSLDMPRKPKYERKTSLHIPQKRTMENGKLGHFFQQRSAISKMIGNWRSMISFVPSRQIRRLNRQQAIYSPEQFLPRVDGSPVNYDTLTLDLFMLGYFHILELDLPSDERKMRHLLCFEVFDHVGRFTWETVRDFHKAVIQDIEAGNREWKDGFEDIKVRFFGDGQGQPELERSEQTATVEKRRVPKVIVQTPTPDESDVLRHNADFTSLSNDEICKYIDRSFAFWKEKEAEIFDFEE